jgi:hypothetical protein
MPFVSRGSGVQQQQQQQQALAATANSSAFCNSRGPTFSYVLLLNK